MSAVNTTGSQDQSIGDAEDLASTLRTLNTDSISEVVEIVHDLDRQITIWKECSGHGSPEDLLRELKRLREIQENQQ